MSRDETPDTTEPLLLSSLRKKPTGDVKHTPATGGALGTSAAGFLREMDDWLANHVAAAREAGRAEERERIAQAIEAERDAYEGSVDTRLAAGWRGGMTNSAAIARHTPGDAS